MKKELALQNGLEARSYVTQGLHQYLDADAWTDAGPNIGINGERLTITFLSLNRSSLSLRLCHSINEKIPNFAGEILVVDNGSNADEILRVKKCLENLPLRVRFVNLQQNYGVAGGRNRTVAQVQTPWVMSLDNDIFFTRNPLPTIQRDIAALGCHFLGLPLLNPDEETLFLRGGHLWLSLLRGEIALGGGAAAQTGADQKQTEGYLCTFLPGGASVFRADTFQSQGGYDEAMFIGFEDFEFSLRLFRAGMKVGATDVRALVHDHPKPDTDDDKQYERNRFARAALEKSARHFERKHGFRVWTPGVDEWIAQREQELGLVTNDSEKGASSPTRRKRIALVVDVRFWALANVARQITHHLSDEFDFEMFAFEDVQEKPEILAYLTRGFDLTHYLWREPLSLVTSPYRKWRIDILFGGWDKFKSTVGAKPRTFTVYDHLFLGPDEINARIPLFTELTNGYTVSSQKLRHIYSSLGQYPAPAAVTQDGVDLSVFKPRHPLRKFGDGGEVRVGWVGNSKWGGCGGPDVKGVNTILLPAIRLLQDEGLPVVPWFADRQSGMRRHEEMPAYYTDIDMLVCASSAEGTPNPVLEAMACGVPVVSTDVGIVSEAFGPLQAQFILKERSTDELARAMRQLMKDPELARRIAAENLSSIQAWDWTKRAEAFRSFFQNAMRSFPNRLLTDSPKAAGRR
jgi:glycosyltransferase involved in cell wall biosynthesis/GT2 family glycosyltransferase